MRRYEWVDRYLGTLLDTDLASMGRGEVRVTASRRRLRCEESYGFVHALLGFCFSDGRVAVSVSPGAGDGVGDALARRPR